MKREDYISRDEYFMWIAVLSAQRSKDPSTQVWACIINDDRKIIWIWYNWFPRWISDDEFSWLESQDFLESRNSYSVHAEANAILNSTKNLKGCTLYCTFFPCNECSKLIVQSGIKQVVFLREKKDKDHQIVSRRILETAWIKLKPLDLKNTKIELDFDKFY